MGLPLIRAICIPSQVSAVEPNTSASRLAISGEILFCSLINADRTCRVALSFWPAQALAPDHAAWMERVGQTHLLKPCLGKAWEIGSLQQRGSQIEPNDSVQTLVLGRRKFIQFKPK